MLDKSEEERYRDWLYESEKKIILPAKTIVLLVSFGMLYFLNREFFFSPWCLYFFLFCLLFRPFFIGYRIYKRLFYKHYLKVSFVSFIWDVLFLVIVICLTGGVRSPLTLVLYAMVIRGAVSYFPSKRLFFSGMATIFLCWITGLFLVEKNFLFLREPILLPQMAFFWILSLASTFAIATLAKEKKALQKSEKSLRSIFDTIDDLLFIADSETKLIRRVNQKALEALGYTREELRSMTVLDLHPVERQEEIVEILQEIIEGRRRFCSIPLSTKKGRLIPVETRVSLGYYEGRLAIIGIGRDITERKKAEEKIKGYQKKINAMINSSKDLIFLKDKDFRYLIANKAHEKVFNIKIKDIIGKTDFDFMPKEVAQGCRKTDKEILKSKGPIEREEFVRDRCFQVVKQKVMDQKGNVIGIAAVIRDITEHKKMEKHLMQSEKLASVGQLAAGAAHEINNPLASILLGAQRMCNMIKKQAAGIPDSQVYLRTLERIERATNRCKRIVAGLLAFSEPTKIQLAPTDINKVMKKTLESLKGQIKAQDVRVVKDFTAQLATIKADGQQLSQVFSNLIVNACEAMLKGGNLTISTRMSTDKRTNEHGFVEVCISDTGKGISREDLPRIFDPFFTTKEAGKGVGLGLPISYGIVAQHGGTIEVSSEKGKGSTFIVRLPVKI